MKKIILNQANALGFIGMMKKMVANNGSIIFPSNGVTGKTSKFGNLRKITSSDPMRLTTHKVEIKLDTDGINFTNPLNEGFGYSNFTIEFGTVIFAYNSFFWKDSWGYWRQMHFSKQLGWALRLTGGRTDTVYNPVISHEEIPSRFHGRVRQFLNGTGDW